MGKIKKSHGPRGNKISLAFKGENGVAAQVGVWLEHLGYSVNKEDEDSDFKILTSTEDARILSEDPDVLVSFNNVDAEVQKELEKRSVVINVNPDLAESKKFEVVMKNLGKYLHL